MPLEHPLEYTNGTPMSESIAKQSYFFLVPNALDELQVLFFYVPSRRICKLLYNLVCDIDSSAWFGMLMR